MITTLTHVMMPRQCIHGNLGNFDSQEIGYRSNDIVWADIIISYFYRMHVNYSKTPLVSTVCKKECSLPVKVKSCTAVSQFI